MPTRPDRYPAPTEWRKSSASADQGGCVEISAYKTFMLVRDSKNPSGVTLRISFGSWRDLISRIRNGRPDRG